MEGLDTLPLGCGVVLQLCPVGRLILLDFFEDVKLSQDGSIDIENVSVKQFNNMVRYIGGWGVTNEVPSEMQDELAMFGKGKRIQRAAWVRMIATEQELAQLLAQVLALTVPVQVQVPPPDQAELEQLKARVAELEAEKEGNGD